MDICNSEKVNHFVQVGLKVGQKLVFSHPLVTIKSNTHFITLIDADVTCFLKVSIAFDKLTSTCIRVQPLLRVRKSEDLTQCLALI
jgi:hypothetical protein